jgi:predicted DNA-binding transcriptional regulator YafY
LAAWTWFVQAAKYKERRSEKNSVPKHDKGISAAVRRDTILAILSRANAKTITEICHELNDRLQTNFSRKSVARDLDELTASHGLQQTPGHPAGFKLSSSFPKNFSPVISSLHMQLLFAALDQLRRQCPPSIVGLAFDLERKILNSLPEDQRRSLASIRPRQGASPSLTGRAKIDDKFLLRALFQAIREKRTISCLYKSPYREESRERRKFGPLLLQFTGGAVYLVVEELAHADGRSPSRFKRIHLARVKALKIEAEEYRAPPFAEYAKWEENFNGLGGGDDPLMDVEILCGSTFGNYLQETEIHPSQRLEPQDNGQTLVRLRVPVGGALVRLLAGFAGDIYAVEPPELRTQLQSSVQAAHCAIRKWKAD